jgi:glycerol-3-phosphate dehydrogenase subunit B
MPEPEQKTADLIIIGSGMAGMAATLFAVKRGLSVIQVGTTGEVGLTSGCFDLMGVHPGIEENRWDDPWAGLEALKKDIPGHPLTRLDKEAIEEAFDELLVFLEETGLPYSRIPDRNVRMITSLGTIKTTYCAPWTMWEGVLALEQKRPCLVVEFKGLKGFSAGLIAEKLKNHWPGIRQVRITFPGMEGRGEVLPEHMANALVLNGNQAKLAQRIRPELKEARCVGLPAVLGLYQSPKVVAELTDLIGVPVFEIPTMPPSIPGLRLKEVFERGLVKKRPCYFSQHKAVEARQGSQGAWDLEVERATGKQTIRSQAVLLATGRFFGGGLAADRKHIYETVFNLPVFQPGSRNEWHRKDFFNRQGHPINRAGVEIDDHFRPINNQGRPVFHNLFAAGSILAHQDWKREKCGTGLAVATAFGAVKAFIEIVKRVV